MFISYWKSRKDHSFISAICAWKWSQGEIWNDDEGNEIQQCNAQNHKINGYLLTDWLTEKTTACQSTQLSVVAFQICPESYQSIASQLRVAMQAERLLSCALWFQCVWWSIESKILHSSPSLAPPPLVRCIYLSVISSHRRWDDRWLPAHICNVFSSSIDRSINSSSSSS